jgi:hypothetical protein
MGRNGANTDREGAGAVTKLEDLLADPTELTKVLQSRHDAGPAVIALLAAERETCAKIFDDLQQDWIEPVWAAKTIRARGGA